MNFKQLVKICICAMLMTSIFSTVASASVSSEIKKYENSNEKQFSQMEKSFKCQYKQFAGHKNVIVISGSANFENMNCVRSFKVLPHAKLRLTDYKGNTETVSVKSLQSKYECYMMAKAPKTFDTSGSLSSNFNAMGK